MKNSDIDSALGAACRAFSGVCEAKKRCCEEAVHRSPLAAVGCAGLIGFLLQRLPLSALVGSLAGLGLRLLKPALLIYGAVKVWEHFSEKSHPERKA
jgi:hypothetical protein